MGTGKSKCDFLEGQMIVAMPGMGDPRFERSVVYICAHSDDGAMGIIVNKPAGDITFADLMEQLNMPVGADPIRVNEGEEFPLVHFGGPVEPGRGFVLHSADYELNESTLAIDNRVGLTATIDVLKKIAEGEGPRRVLLALGYAGWAPGQLEAEMKQNGWLHCPSDEDLLFSRDMDEKYVRALAKMGVDPAMLSENVGRA